MNMKFLYWFSLIFCLFDICAAAVAFATHQYKWIAGDILNALFQFMVFLFCCHVIKKDKDKKL